MESLNNLVVRTIRNYCRLNLILFHDVVAPVQFEELLPFFDLSGVPGVKELPRTQDSNSGPIFIPGPSASLLYGDELITKVYVSVIPSKYNPLEWGI